MIASYYLVLTVWFSGEAANQISVPMESEAYCRVSGEQYISNLDKAEGGYTPHATFICVRSRF